MVLIQLLVVVFTIVFGITNQIIDHKHRNNKAYAPGDAWAYCLEAKFVVWSTYCGIGLIVAALAYLAYRLFTA